MGEQISFNGVDVWARIRERDGGIQVRLSPDDWDHLSHDEIGIVAS